MTRELLNKSHPPTAVKLIASVKVQLDVGVQFTATFVKSGTWHGTFSRVNK